jgi:hypothetical protein
VGFIGEVEFGLGLPVSPDVLGSIVLSVDVSVDDPVGEPAMLGFGLPDVAGLCICVYAMAATATMARAMMITAVLRTLDCIFFT